MAGPPAAPQRKSTCPILSPMDFQLCTGHFLNSLSGSSHTQQLRTRVLYRFCLSPQMVPLELAKLKTFDLCYSFMVAPASSRWPPRPVDSTSRRT